MKKYLNDLIIFLLLGVVLTIFYFYLPPSFKSLHQRINQSQSLIADENRQKIIKEYEDYLFEGLPQDVPKLYFYWFAHQRKISDSRIQQAIKEIENSTVPINNIQVWSFLNMGAVIKTADHIIAIDTANLPFSYAHNRLTDIANIFLVSHEDGDHYDHELLQKALEKGKKVALLENFFFNSSNSENVIKLVSGKTQNIDGVNITAYQTDHRGDGNFNNANAWFVIEVDKFKLLHTGDGRDFKDKDEQKAVYSAKDYDILLGNVMLHSLNTRDIRPKVFIPLHLFKFMSGQELYQDSTITKVRETHKQYQTDLSGIEKVYLLPGESFIYPLNLKILQ